MSALAMIEMLKRVGYPGADRLDPQSMDWAFEEPSTAAFMQWVCSIGKENVLTKEEMEEYESLVLSGQVLTGSHLKEALEISKSQDKDTDDDADDKDDEDDEARLQLEILQLEEEVQKVEDRKKELVKDRQHLELKQMSLKTKAGKIDELMNHAKKSYHSVLDKTSSHSAKIDESLTKLSESVARLTDLYPLPRTEKTIRTGLGKRAEEAKFLSQVDLSKYHQAEERFSQDLTAFTKKRFFEGLSGIAGQRETSQYSLLDISQPDNVAAADDQSDKDLFLEDCQEFSLLQQIFPDSEVNRLNGLINARKAAQAVQEAKAILNLLRTEQFPSSPTTISRLQAKADEHIRQAQDEAHQFQAVLPSLVHQLASLQGTEILTGNYDLKLKRQDYFTNNQDKVIASLEGQRSRSELLLMLYDLELKFHERTHHLLCATDKMLETHLHNWTHRMKCLDDPDLSQSRFERNVVDARDTSTNSLYQMMATSSTETEDGHLYIPLDKVKARARSLSTRLESSQTSQQTDEKDQTANLSLLEDCVKQGKRTLYSGSSTSSGLPNLSPADVQASMVSLQGRISSLRSNVDRLVTDIKNKKKMLKSNPVICKERELFTFFHTKPEYLTSTIQALEEKTKKQSSVR